MRMILEVFTPQPAKNDLGAVGQAVHQYLVADHNQEIPFTPLSQLKSTVIGGDAFYGFPGLCHGAFLSRSVGLYRELQKIDAGHNSGTFLCVLSACEQKKQSTKFRRNRNV